MPQAATKPQIAPKPERMKAAIYELDQIRAERCRQDFFYLLQLFWPEICTDDLILNWHIEYLCNQLMEIARQVGDKKPKLHDLIINIPPGTTKSLICTVMFPVWCWINWYWMRFIALSYSGSLALEHAEMSRDLVKSDKFRKLFPELSIKRDKDMKSNFRLVKTTIGPAGQERVELGGNRFSTSVGGTLTGYHAHILLVDDPINPAQAVSEKELKTANEWLDSTISTRKVDKAITPTIVIMQRLHQDDPTGHMLAKKKDKLFHVCLPGEIKNYKEQLNPPELEKFYVDGLLDPVRMDWEVIKELEADLGQYGYAGQIGQNPTPPAGGMFKVDHFQAITAMPMEVNILQTVRYWDKAGTAGGGAYTRGVKMHKMKNGKFIISDVKGGQWDTDERERIILETAEADSRKVHVYVEQEPGSGGKESAQATIRNLAGFVCSADRPTGDKVFRADPYSVQVNNGNVLLLVGEWHRDFIEEHRFFPFSTYKDQVDAASGAFGKLSNRRMAGPIC